MTNILDTHEAMLSLALDKPIAEQFDDWLSYANLDTDLTQEHKIVDNILTKLNNYNMSPRGILHDGYTKFSFIKKPGDSF